MFLDFVSTCHGPDKIVAGVNGQLQCTECQTVQDAYAFILQASVSDESDPFFSARLAREYANWTGDLNVPCTFPLIGLPGIVSIRNVPVTLRILLNGIRLLQCVNAPFRANAEPPEAYESLERFMIEYMDEYAHYIEKAAHETDPSQVDKAALHALFTNMKSLIEHVDQDEDEPFNFLGYYSKVLAPYVKTCDSSWFLLPPPSKENEKDPAYQLCLEMKASNQVRARYSPYATLFDLVHVMIYCYLCRNEMNVVANLVFDFGARICRRTFFYKESAWTQQLRKLVASQVTYHRNTEFYYILRQIQRGETCEALSIDFIEKMGRLEALLTKGFIGKATDDRIQQFAFKQNFPYVLFVPKEDEEETKRALQIDEYLGFLFGTGFIISKVKGKGLVKGSIATGKKFYRLIQKVALKVREFEKNDGDLFWTMEMVKLFLCSDGYMEKELKMLLNVVTTESRREEGGAMDIS